MTVMAIVPLVPIGLALGLLVMLVSACILFSEFRDLDWRHTVVVFSVALLVAGVILSADTPYLDLCSEAHLRERWGDWWEWAWYAQGCYLP